MLIHAESSDKNGNEWSGPIYKSRLWGVLHLHALATYIDPESKVEGRLYHWFKWGVNASVIYWNLDNGFWML